MKAERGPIWGCLGGEGRHECFGEGNDLLNFIHAYEAYLTAYLSLCLNRSSCS